MKSTRCLIPAGGKPINFFFFTVAIDFLVFLRAELDPAAVIQVGHQSPGRFSHHIPVFGRDGHFGCALLEFDRVTAGHHRNIDQSFCNVEIAVMVDTDLSGNERPDSRVRLGSCRFL